MDKKKTGTLSGVVFILIALAGTYFGLNGGSSVTGEKSLFLEKGEEKTETAADPVSRQLRGLEIPYSLDGSESVLVEHMAYTVSYNSKYRIPNWVAYELQDSELYGNLERQEKFGPDPLVKGRQAYDKDYVGSGWDRGHMAPSGDMKWSSQAMKECYYLTNICPQNHNLNAGVWNDLEKQVRYEARYYKKVWVVCGPVVDRGRGTIGSNKVLIPDGFFKALLARKKDGTYTAIGFTFPNEAGTRPLRDYALSVNDLEKKLGMDLFYNLDDSVQETVEASYSLRDWRIEK